MHTSQSAHLRATLDATKGSFGTTRGAVFGGVLPNDREKRPSSEDDAKSSEGSDSGAGELKILSPPLPLQLSPPFPTFVLEVGPLSSRRGWRRPVGSDGRGARRQETRAGDYHPTSVVVIGQRRARWGPAGCECGGASGGRRGDWPAVMSSVRADDGRSERRPVVSVVEAGRSKSGAVEPG